MVELRHDRGRHPIESFLLYAVFFASGASGLICEITWARMLVLVLGNTMVATGVILAAFMGGLVLGSYYGGRYVGRRSVSLLPYALLELGIGTYAIASPSFFHPASQLFTFLVTDLSTPALLVSARLALAFVCLLVPAALMGATFPAIIAGSAGLDPFRQAARTGYLYSVNTFGGAIGSFVAGYYLVPRLGAFLTLGLACLASFFAASGALVLQRFIRDHSLLAMPATAPAPQPVYAAPVGHAFPRWVMLATLLVGFVSLAYEVLLTRLVILYFGNTLEVFALVVTVFLLGIGLSALMGTWGYGVIRSLNLLSGVTMLSGICLAVPPFLLVALSSAGQGRTDPYQDLVVGGIMLAPAFVLGSVLPIAIRVFQSQAGGPSVAREAGALYAVNTLGGMLAAGFTNPILVPAFGVEGTLISLSLACVIMGLVLWRPHSSLVGRRVIVSACALAIAVAMPLSPYRLETLYAGKLAEYSGRDIDATVKLYHEGAVATAIVLDFPWLGFRDMFLNGVEEASTRFGHIQLFKLLGVLPVLVHESDQPKEALMIAFGAGIAAGTTLGSGLVSSLACVDLNPDIASINELFREVNGDVYHDARFHFISEDGRNYLLRRSKQYPIIISDSTHPRAYDSWILYTEEFYRLVRKRLSPDGVFAQWVPLSDISVEQYRILLHTFRKVFPNVTFWNIYGTDQAFLLGTQKPFVFDVKRIQNLLDRIPESVQLKQYQLDTAVKIGGFFVMDRERIDEFIGDEVRTNSDNRPFHQKQALRQFTPLKVQSFDRYQASLPVHATHTSEAERAAMEDRQILARAMQRLFFFKDDEALREAALIDPIDGNVLFHQQLASARMAMLLERSRRNASQTNAEVVRLREVVSRSPGDARAYVDLAELYLKQHHIAEAEGLLTTALQQDPDSLPARKALAQVYQVTDRWREATSLLESIFQSSPDDTAARTALIELYAQHKENQKALAMLQAIGPSGEDDFRYHVTVAGAHFALSQYREAERELSRALEIYPANTQARWYLSELYLKTQRRAACLEQVERLLAINPYHEAGLRRLIGLYKETGQHEKVAPLEAKLARARKLSAMQG